MKQVETLPKKRFEVHGLQFGLSTLIHDIDNLFTFQSGWQNCKRGLRCVPTVNENPGQISLLIYPSGWPPESFIHADFWKIAANWIAFRGYIRAPFCLELQLNFLYDGGILTSGSTTDQEILNDLYQQLHAHETKTKEFNALQSSVAVMLFKLDEWFLNKSLGGYGKPSFFGGAKLTTVSVSVVGKNPVTEVAVKPIGWKGEDKVTMLLEKHDSHGEIWIPRRVIINIHGHPHLHNVEFVIDERWNLLPDNNSARVINSPMT